MQPTPVFLPEKSHGQRSLVGYSPWGHKDSDMTEHTHTHAAQSLISLKSFFFLPHCMACGIFVPQLGIDPMCPQHWEYRVLTLDCQRSP